MAERPASKFIQLLGVLAGHEVEFIVIGGVAAVLEGVPIMTFDLDVVYDRSPENIPRLARALQEINAIYRDPAGRRIVPDAGKLETIRMHRLRTDLGYLDVLASIGPGLTYSDLIGRTNEHEVGNLCVRALDLPTIIETKEYANRPKDQHALLFIRQTLELKKSSRPEPEQ